MRRYEDLARFCLVLFAACGVLASPTAKNEVEDLFKGSKREVSPVGASTSSALLKSALVNPYLYPPFGPLIPGKPFFYPLLTPPDILLNRFAKFSSTPSPLQGSSSGSYYKSKKDEFLTKLFEGLQNASDSSEVSARSVTDDPAGPTMDPSYFMIRKLDFLEKLFKAINATTTSTPPTETEGTTAAATPKPTIVPPSFWFPIIKPPKPPKAPKPTKPPKTKKILKDALDTMILQSLLADFGLDLNATLSKRAVAPPKKSKKVKPEVDEAEFHIPTKIDPTLYSAKASDCLDKLFKILSKADAEDLSNFIEPKATVIPANMWTQPSETEYTSKLDAFLDLLLKSMNATDATEPTKPTKPTKKVKTFPKVIKKRSTFLDELLHRATTPPPTTVEPETTKCPCVPASNSCCCTIKCLLSAITEDDSKSKRSLIFKPFGTGYWIPQYLYAAKMGLYLDKLMDTINTAAAEDVSSPSMKRSVPTDDKKINITGMSPKDAALTLLIAELIEVKNDIVDAFGDGVKAQKDAATVKPFSPAGKSFKKPFWGPKATPTTDPVEPIQKRIDILNSIFDKITEVEKTILFAPEANNQKIISSIKEKLQTQPKLSSFKTGKTKADEDSPDYYIEKTRDFLQSLYASKLNEASEEDD